MIGNSRFYFTPNVNSTICLTHGLLDAGAYEEALVLMQHTVALARTLPPTIIFQRVLIALGRTYHALQQWEEARSTLKEAEVLAESLNLGPLRVSALSQLCMHYALARQWEAAYRYALKAITVRKSSDVALIVLDFYRQYETEALLRGGDESQARAEVQRLGELLGPYRRFRLPYLRSLAVLAAWEGHSEQAIGHLHEAAQLAADLGTQSGGLCGRENSGRFKRRWEGCMRQRACLCKRAPRLLRRRRSSRGWQRASGMRRGVRTFWLRH